MKAIKEIALLLGPRKSMVAVATPAVGSAPDSGALTAVILNSGIVHRVGANRMSVDLARTLAVHGINAVRFDLSGIGDSEPRNDDLAPWQASMADIREALDSLQASRRVSRVVLIGLCSGADQALVYGPQDPRVVGVVLIDPSIPTTRWYWVQYYKRQATNLESWRRLAWDPNSRWRLLARRIVGDQTEQTAPSEAESAPRAQRRLQDEPEVRTYLGQAYQRILAAGVHILTVTTGERTYRDQLMHAFPDVEFNDLIRLEHFDDADHVFSSPSPRQRAIDLIVSWVEELQAATGAVAERPHPPLLEQAR